MEKKRNVRIFDINFNIKKIKEKKRETERDREREGGRKKDYSILHKFSFYLYF